MALGEAPECQAGVRVAGHRHGSKSGAQGVRVNGVVAGKGLEQVTNVVSHDAGCTGHGFPEPLAHKGAQAEGRAVPVLIRRTCKYE